MKVEERSLDTIKPYDNNPRYNDAGVDAVASSIREFGFRVPIVVDEQGVIIAGHTRYLALRELGWKVLRLWDFEIDADAQGCAIRVGEALDQSENVRPASVRPRQ